MAAKPTLDPRPSALEANFERCFRTLKERVRGFYQNINSKTRGLLALNTLIQILGSNRLRSHQEPRSTSSKKIVVI